ncbi:MAG: diguanylate cyclase/phosphodiesterase (GGDEF & EAL domains) with PAS/PAC sensor(s), partial [uncultured Ramlibacter sp.]
APPHLPRPRCPRAARRRRRDRVAGAGGLDRRLAIRPGRRRDHLVGPTGRDPWRPGGLCAGAGRSLRPLRTGVPAQGRRPGAGLPGAGHAVRRGGADRAPGRSARLGPLPGPAAAHGLGRGDRGAGRGAGDLAARAAGGHAAAPHREHGRRAGRGRCLRHRGQQRPVHLPQRAGRAAAGVDHRPTAGPAVLECVPEDRAAAAGRAVPQRVCARHPAGVRGDRRAAVELVRSAWPPVRRRHGRAPAGRHQAAQGAGATAPTGGQHRAPERHRHHHRGRALQRTRPSHRVRQRGLRAPHRLQPRRGAGPHAAHAAGTQHAAPLARPDPCGAGRVAAGARGPDQLQEERRAVLGGPGCLPGVGQAAQADPLGGGGPRRDRAQAGRREDPAPGLLRPADQAAQPAAAHGSPARRPVGPGAPARRRSDVHRPGQLQGAQRHAGAPEGRHAAAAGGRAAALLRGQGRHRGAPGRRRVRDPAGEPRRQAVRSRHRRPCGRRTHPGGAGRALRAARPHAPQHLQHRRDAVRPQRPHRERAAQAGRPGHVPGQGCRAQHRLLLRPRDAGGRHGQRDARLRPAPGLARAAVPARLPAAGGRRRAHDRGGGPAALAPPGARPGGARAVHLRGRGDLADPA